MTSVEKQQSVPPPQNTAGQPPANADTQKPQDEKIPENPEAIMKKDLAGKEIDLKKAENQAISGYKLVPGDYRILVRILEANDLVPRMEEGWIKNTALGMLNNKDGSANPYVTVELLDKVKKTTIKKKTLNPIYNEQFYFEFKGLIMSQLEEASLVFRVMDYNGMVQPDTLIGTFEVDITTIYFSLNHEICNATLLLYDPDDKSASTSGMLKVNLECLGPKDEPNVHNAITQTPNTNKEKIMKPAALKPIGHNVEVNFFRAEHLPILDFSTEGIDAFAVVKYAGVVKSTKIVTSFNPEWNQNIKLACMLPNQSKAVNVEIWDYDLLNKNDLVGTFKVDFKSFQDKFLAPRWVNLYGPPVSATEDDIAETMRLYGYDIGSHYMGRVLYSIGSYNEKDPKTKITNLNFKFPDNPEPVSAERTYILRVDLYEAQEVPDREMCIISITCGPYLIKSVPKKIKNGRCRIYQRFEDKKLVLPANLEEVPDIIVYFSDADKENRRHSFARFKVYDPNVKPDADPNKNILNPPNPSLRSIKLKEDRSLNLVTDDEFPGYLFAKIGLYNQAPPARAEFKKEKIKFDRYQLRVMIHVARDLPPADQEGTSDPFIVVRAAGESRKTTVKRQTLNPGWYETLVMDVDIPSLKDSEVPEGISLLVYDSDSHRDEDYDEKELLGRAWLRIQNQPREYYDKLTKQRYSMIYQRPVWKSIIYDATEQYQGKILVSYALIPAEHKHMVPFKQNIQPESSIHKIHLFLIGVRDINMDELGFLKPLHVSATFDVSGDSEEATETEKQLIVNNGANINMYKELTIGVPFSRALTPLLDVHLHGWKLGASTSQMIGYSSIDLKGTLDDFYKTNNPSTVKSVSTLIDIKEEASSPGLKSKVNLALKKENSQNDPNNITFKKDPKSQPDVSFKRDAEVKLNTQPDQMDANVLPKIAESLNEIKLEMKEETKSPTKSKQQVDMQQQQEDNRLDTVEEQKTLLEKEAENKARKLKRLQQKKEQRDQRRNEESKKFVDTFTIHRENTFDDDKSRPEDEFLELDNIEREIQPDRTKGNFELPERGQIAKKGGAMSRFQELIFGKEEKIEYEGYDSQPDEDLDVIPLWIKGRDTLPNEMEDTLPKNLEIKSFPIKRGRTRGNASWFGMNAPTGVSTIANLKAIFLEGTEEQILKKRDEYVKLMEPKKYACRVYILEGVNITKPGKPNELPDSYLVVKIGKDVQNDRKNSLRTQTSRPEYFHRYDFLLDVPSASSLEVEVWHHNSLLKDELLGKTTIDLEERHFNPNWREKYKIKPIEYRNLMNEDEKGTYGKLSLWVDLEPVQDKVPIHEIAPVEKVECELRCIVWEAKEFEHNDTTTQSSDLFIRGSIGGKDYQDTDTHWRARAKASFNWRYKFKMTLPLGRDGHKENIFKVQLFDKDVLTSNAMIGETEIDLNTHRMLDKVYKRREAVGMKLKYTNAKKQEIKTDRIWYDVFHPTKKDAEGNKISTGKVLMSFELMPDDAATKKPNGMGRDAPNNFPNLSDPVGRFSFDILSPLKTLKELIGPSLYRKLCCGLCCIMVLVIGIMFGYFILTSAVGAAIAK